MSTVGLWRWMILSIEYVDRRPMVVAISSFARILGKCLTIHSRQCFPPLFFESGHQLISTLYAKISLQWLSELRRLWANVLWEVVREVVSQSVPTLCLDSGIVSPFPLRWVKDVCEFRCNLPPALLAEWPGSFTCHCGNTGVERTPSKSQHTKSVSYTHLTLPTIRCV